MSIDWISVRKILPKERVNRGIILASKVPNRVVEYESCLERDLYLLCNHAPSVRRYQHQPITIEYKDNKGKARKYTPDTYVEYIIGNCGLYEIKYEEEIIVNRKKYKKRWNAAKEWAKKHGIEFAVLTEKEIRTAIRRGEWFTLGIRKWNDLIRYIFGEIKLTRNKYIGGKGLKIVIKELMEFKKKYKRKPKSNDKGMSGIYKAVNRGEWTDFGIKDWSELIKIIFHDGNSSLS